MRAEVPHDAHVGLVQSEIHTAGGNEVDLAELAGVDEALDCGHRRAVEEGMSGHEHEPIAPRELGQLDHVLRGSGQRLLDEDMLAGFQCCLRKRVVSRDRCRNRDRLDRGIAEKLFVMGRARKRRITARQRFHRLRTDVAERRDVERWRFGQVADEIRPPVAQADDADPHALAASPGLRRHQPVSRLRSMRRGVRSSRRTSRPKDQPRAYATSRSSASPNVE